MNIVLLVSQQVFMHLDFPLMAKFSWTFNSSSIADLRVELSPEKIITMGQQS